LKLTTQKNRRVNLVEEGALVPLSVKEIPPQLVSPPADDYEALVA
jgi:hypothetical protein